MSAETLEQPPYIPAGLKQPAEGSNGTLADLAAADGLDSAVATAGGQLATVTDINSYRHRQGRNPSAGIARPDAWWEGPTHLTAGSTEWPAQARTDDAQPTPHQVQDHVAGVAATLFIREKGETTSADSPTTAEADAAPTRERLLKRASSWVLGRMGLTPSGSHADSGVAPGFASRTLNPDSDADAARRNHYFKRLLQEPNPTGQPYEAQLLIAADGPAQRQTDYRLPTAGIARGANRRALDPGVLAQQALNEARAALGGNTAEQTTQASGRPQVRNGAVILPRVETPRSDRMDGVRVMAPPEAGSRTDGVTILNGDYDVAMQKRPGVQVLSAEPAVTQAAPPIDRPSAPVLDAQRPAGAALLEQLLAQPGSTTESTRRFSTERLKRVGRRLVAAAGVGLVLVGGLTAAGAVVADTVRPAIEWTTDKTPPPFPGAPNGTPMPGDPSKPNMGYPVQTVAGK